MMRKFLALGLAFCLFNLELSFSFQQVASTAPIPTKAANSWVKVEFSTAAAATKTTTSTFKPQKIDTVDYISLITMLVLAVAATALVVTCAIGPNYDVYLFAASALTYILGEIAVNLSYKKINTKEIEYNANSDLTDKQYQSLVDLRNSYKDVKGSAETKRTLQLAAGAGMLVSAAIATADYIVGKSLHAKCMTALAAAKAKAASNECTKCFSTAIAAMAAEIKKESFKAILNFSAMASAVSRAQAAAVTAATTAGCGDCPAAIAVLKAGCEDKWAIKDQTEPVSCVPFAYHQSPPWLFPSEQNWLAKASELLFPSAKASDFMSLLGIGAAGLGIVAGLLIAKKTFIDKLVSHPGKRALLFAAAGAIAMATSMSTSNIIKSCKSNIDKIDKILNQYASYDDASSVHGGDIIKGNITTKQSGDTGVGVPFTLPNGQKIGCLLKENKDGSCPSLSVLNENAQKKDSKTGEVPIWGQLSLDPGMASAASNIMRGVDEVQGNSTLSAGALEKFAAAAQQQAAVQKNLDAQRKNLNDLLKDTGEKPIDFAAQEKDLQTQLSQNTMIALQEQGKTTDDLLKEGLLLSPLMDTGKIAADTKSQIATLDLGKLKQKGKTNRARPLMTSAPEVSPGKQDELKNSANENEYEYEAEMISDDGHTLWEVLTNRYHSSGYRNLFNLKGNQK